MNLETAMRRYEDFGRPIIVHAGKLVGYGPRE